MKQLYIQSGILFDRKQIGTILVSRAYNIATTQYYKNLTKEDILYDIVETIEGNIWRAYCSKYFDEVLDEIISYCIKRTALIIKQIDNTGYNQATRQAAKDMLKKIIE